MEGFTHAMLTYINRIFKKSKKCIVVVSGLPRSGTSMMMKMLDAGGLPPLTDQKRTPDSDNPKGYYEYERVKRLKKGDTSWLSQAEGKSVKVISALLQYLPNRYDYRVILMRRELREILASQRKMIENRGEETESASDEEMIVLYTKHLQQVESWLKSTSHMRHIDIDFNGVISDPWPYLKKIQSFLGRNLDTQEMATVIDPTLYRQRR